MRTCGWSPAGPAARRSSRPLPLAERDHLRPGRSSASRVVVEAGLHPHRRSPRAARRSSTVARLRRRSTSTSARARPRSRGSQAVGLQQRAAAGLRERVAADRRCAAHVARRHGVQLTRRPRAPPAPRRAPPASSPAASRERRRAARARVVVRRSSAPSSRGARARAARVRTTAVGARRPATASARRAPASAGGSAVLDAEPRGAVSISSRSTSSGSPRASARRRRRVLLPRAVPSRAGSSTRPPPIVSGGAMLRSTKRSPAAGHRAGARGAAARMPGPRLEQLALERRDPRRRLAGAVMDLDARAAPQRPRPGQQSSTLHVEQVGRPPARHRPRPPRLRAATSLRSMPARLSATRWPGLGALARDSPCTSTPRTRARVPPGSIRTSSPARASRTRASRSRRCRCPAT